MFVLKQSHIVPVPHQWLPKCQSELPTQETSSSLHADSPDTNANIILKIDEAINKKLHTLEHVVI